MDAFWQRSSSEAVGEMSKKVGTVFDRRSGVKKLGGCLVGRKEQLDCEFFERNIPRSSKSGQGREQRQLDSTQV
jgi:hypothetical protein